MEKGNVDVIVPRCVRSACQALAELGVSIRPELLVTSAAAVEASPDSPAGQSKDGVSGAESPLKRMPPSAAPMELWKALHDLIITTIFLRNGVRLPPHALAEAWRKISLGGPQAVRFESIQAMIQVKMRDFGYGHALPPTCAAADLLRAFCWLVAQCEVLYRHANARCADAVRGTPLLSMKGSKMWACAPSNSGDAHASTTEVDSMKTIPTPPPSVDGATFNISAECGRLWHAVRELATAEERRTLLLRRLWSLQVPLRLGTSRLLTPTELEAQLRNEDPEMRELLDSRIANVKLARDACMDAVAFWEWCSQNVLPPSSSELIPINKAGEDLTAEEMLAGLRVDELIRDAFGLEVRKPRVWR